MSDEELLPKWYPYVKNEKHYLQEKRNRMWLNFLVVVVFWFFTLGFTILSNETKKSIGKGE